MDTNTLQQFIKTYEEYYYEVSPESRKRGKAELGLSIIHPTKREDEERIMRLLEAGEQNVETIAWKMGVNSTDEGIRTQYHEYPIEEIKKFCNSTNNLSLTFENDEDIRHNYDAVLECVEESGLFGYGSVYIISSLFFISKGKVPIYDYYANVAVKALVYNVNPQDVYVAQAPSKEEHSRNDKTRKSAVNMLLEYKHLLKTLADGTKYFNTDGMYISRSLDRALWVYGHANKKWPDEIDIYTDNLSRRYNNENMGR